MLHTDLRPILESIQFGLDRFNGLKTTLLEVLLARLNFAGGQLHDVYNSQMNSANFGGIVVDQADDAMLAIALNRYFLVEFPLHTGAIPIFPRCVLNRNVTANTNGTKGM